MKVILLDDMPNLGEAGSVVEVKDGYARNYLLPRSLAERATRDALNRVTLIQRAAEVKRARRKSEAAATFLGLEGKVLKITVKAGSQGRIFGSITSQQIVDEARKQLSINIDRRHVVLEDPIRHLGEFTVPLRASADVQGELKISVEPEGPKAGRGPGRRAQHTVDTDTLAQAESATPAPEETEAAASDDDASQQIPREEPAEAVMEEQYEDLETRMQGTE
jgi:large subunit ribosomal protein L9